MGYTKYFVKSVVGHIFSEMCRGLFLKFIYVSFSWTTQIW